MNDATHKPATQGKGLAKSPGALAGLKVIDLTRVLGGPYLHDDPVRSWRRRDQDRATSG